MKSSGYWEGGKGCRNQETMSSRDSHKFTGSSLKTISRKKRNKMEENKKE